MSDKFQVLSLFSGGMGLDIGLESTGRFRTVLCIEKDRSSCDTIRLNSSSDIISKPHVLHADITTLDPAVALKSVSASISSIDVLAGGPPCQSFSTAGKRRSTRDPRGALLWHFLRFVEYVKPRLFLLENVRGLLSSSLNRGHGSIRGTGKGSVLRLLAQDFYDIGYTTQVFVVNSVNYGSPQNRERIFVVGLPRSSSRVIRFPQPTHGPGYPLPWRTIHDAWNGLHDPFPQVLDFSPRKKKYLSMVPEGSNWRSLPEDIQKESMGRAYYAKGGRSGWWRRLTFDLPSPTLLTMPNHSSTSLCHPTETRALSVKEYARIQEFPDKWRFSGTLQQQYAQIGNAVPIRLGQVVGDVIASILDDKDYTVADSFLSPMIVHINPHVRTRTWKH